MIIVQLHKLHRNRRGETISSLEALPPSDPMYAKGFRFKDDQDRTYRDNGAFNQGDNESKYDLVRAL